MHHVKVMIVRRTNHISYSSLIRKSIIDKYLSTYFFYFFNINFSLGNPPPPSPKETKKVRRCNSDFKKKILRTVLITEVTHWKLIILNIHISTKLEIITLTSDIQCNLGCSIWVLTGYSTTNAVFMFSQSITQGKNAVLYIIKRLLTKLMDI